MKDDSNFGKYLIKNTDSFVQSDDSQITKVVMAWGMMPQDISACHHTDTECTGRNVWDEQFDVDSLEVQQALMVSQKLRVFQDPEENTISRRLHGDIHIMF